jgi:hypothetical protein
MSRAVKTYPRTRSPFFTCVTPSPTSCTSPATSVPQMLGYFCRKMPKLISYCQHRDSSANTIILNFPYTKSAAAKSIQSHIPTIDRVDGDRVILDHDFALASCWHGSFFDLQRVALGLRDPCGFVGHGCLLRMINRCMQGRRVLVLQNECWRLLVRSICKRLDR